MSKLDDILIGCFPPEDMGWIYESSVSGIYKWNVKAECYYSDNNADFNADWMKMVTTSVAHRNYWKKIK